MQVFLIAALTNDGFIARKEDHRSFNWTSLEDKKFYVGKIKVADAIIMGRKTFKTVLRHPKGSHWFIYTSRPRDFVNPKPAVITAEGISDEPQELLEKLENQGFQQVAICGGASIYSMFVKTGLVDTLYLTIEEAVTFGEGVKLLNQKSEILNPKFGDKKIKLFGFEYQLVTTERLAEKTKVLIYKLKTK